MTASLVWPETSAVPVAAIDDVEDNLDSMVAVLNTGGRREAAKFIAATVVAALDGSATRYAVVESDGTRLYGIGPFASATSATKFADGPRLREGNSVRVMPLTPAPKVNRPRYLKS